MAISGYSEEYRTTLVCVDSYQKGVPQGRFYNPYMEAEQTFQSLTQFLQGMEKTLEMMDFPKAFTATPTVIYAISGQKDSTILPPPVCQPSRFSRKISKSCSALPHAVTVTSKPH